MVIWNKKDEFNVVENYSRKVGFLVLKQTFKRFILFPHAVQELLEQQMCYIANDLPKIVAISCFLADLNKASHWVTQCALKSLCLKKKYKI